jgi:hypothetical protein
MGITDSTDGISALESSYADPTRLWAHAFSPKNLKQLFQWTEYLYYNSAQIYAGVKKFAEYPITELSYITDSPTSKEKYKRMLERVLGIKRELIRASLDLHVYGNSFTSVHFPFKRFLVCSSCGAKEDIQFSTFSVKPSKLRYTLTCSSCDYRGVAEVDDKRVLDPQKINVIRWDPKLIDIGYNPVTAEAEYFYSIPSGIKSKVLAGDKHLLTTMPMSVLKAIKEDKLYKFAQSEIFHLKSDAPAGVASGWGYPPLTSTIHLFYHASVLRKANEAIALERMVPMRILHPQATSGNADPIMTMSMGRFMDDLEGNLKQWRKDPNHIMMSPVAVGTTQVGGEGRALMVSQEIDKAEDNIIAALGIPKEFIYGGLSFTGSSVTLRMLENQLESSTFQLTNLLKWVATKVGSYLSWGPVEVRLGDFKMIDDVQQKQLMVNLWQSGVVSKTTLAETHGLDLAEERDRIKQEAVSDARLQQEIERDVQAIQASISHQAQQAAGGQQGLNYDQQAVIGEADMVAQQFSQMDEGQRRSQLSALQAEDYVMYSVVIQRLEQIQLDMKNQAVSQIRGA